VQISRSGFLKLDSPVYIQTGQIRGGSNGWRRRSSVYLSQVNRFPRVRRFSHFLQILTTPR